MKAIFVDTSALIAIGNKRDLFHARAVEMKARFKQEGRHFVTTSAVLLELGNAFSLAVQKPTAIILIQTIRHSPKWTCVSLNEKLFESGFDLYQQMQDKDWGLIDCMSILIAREMEITEIFTADHHFEQAGLRILLK